MQPWRNAQWLRRSCSGFDQYDRVCHFYQRSGETTKFTRFEEYEPAFRSCAASMRASAAEIRDAGEAWVRVDKCMAANGWNVALEVWTP